MTSTTSDRIRVALRVRPLLKDEKAQNCSLIISYPNQDQVIIGIDRAFSFDFVFNENSSQEYFYQTCIMNLVDNFFAGYNATLLAYGQTGSGKTYTMGTADCSSLLPDEMGVLPRAVNNIFDKIEQKEGYESVIHCSFLEIYNDDIFDLFDSIEGKSKIIKIVERNNDISVVGLEEKEVKNAADMLKLLRVGASNRTTASTQMNTVSSRSHAVFTIYLTQKCIEDNANADDIGQEECLSSKFHFVDLAGSERLKRTQSVGDRMKEGININQGLLALGNVISKLSDNKTRSSHSHIPFRDSKITRILQDSLGGNSQTMMIACISPADINFEETLNCLKYAHRAKNIRNKPIVNRDPTHHRITELNKRIKELENILKCQGGDTSDNVIINNREYQQLQDDNQMFSQEVERLNKQLKEGRLREDKFNEELKKSQRDHDQVVHSYNQLLDFVKNNNIDISSIQKDININILDQSDVIIELKRENTLLKEQQLNLNKQIKSLEDNNNFLLQEDFFHKQKNLFVENEKLKYDNDSLRRLSGLELSPFLNHNSSISLDLSFSNEEEKNSLDIEENEIDVIEQSSVNDEKDLLKNQYFEDRKVEEELFNIDEDLQNKQKLMVELIQTRSKVLKVKEHFETKIEQLTNKIHSLENEKNETLKNYSNKVEEEKIRREYEEKLKKIKEELSIYQKKMKEHDRLIKMRNKDDLKIRQLQQSIDNMKKQKVILIKQQKQMSEKHQTSMNQAKRHVNQLMKKEMKNEQIMNSLQIKYDHSKQQVSRLKDEKKKLENELKKPTNFGKTSLHIDKFKNILIEYVEKHVKRRELSLQFNKLIQRKNEIIDDLSGIRYEIGEIEYQIDQEINIESGENQLELLKDREESMNSQLDFINVQCWQIEEQRLQLGYKGPEWNKSTKFFEEKEIMNKINANNSDLKSLLFYFIKQLINLKISKEKIYKSLLETQHGLQQKEEENNEISNRLKSHQREYQRKQDEFEMEFEKRFRSLINIEEKENKNENEQILEEIKLITQEKQNLQNPDNLETHDYFINSSLIPPINLLKPPEHNSIPTYKKNRPRSCPIRSYISFSSSDDESKNKRKDPEQRKIMRDPNQAALRRKEYLEKQKFLKKKEDEKRKNKAFLLKETYQKENTPVFDRLSDSLSFTGISKNLMGIHHQRRHSDLASLSPEIDSSNFLKVDSQTSLPTLTVEDIDVDINENEQSIHSSTLQINSHNQTNNNPSPLLQNAPTQIQILKNLEVNVNQPSPSPSPLLSGYTPSPSSISQPPDSDDEVFENLSSLINQKESIKPSTSPSTNLHSNSLILTANGTNVTEIESSSHHTNLNSSNDIVQTIKPNVTEIESSSHHTNLNSSNDINETEVDPSERIDSLNLLDDECNDVLQAIYLLKYGD